MVDLQDLLALLAASIQSKRDLLIKILLTNTAEAGDILFDSPVTAIKNIEFPYITARNVCKAVLEARNIAPSSDENPTKILQIAWP